MSIYSRHMRYRRFHRVRYSDDLLSFLDSQANRLAGSGSGKTITFSNTTDTIHLPNHGYQTGDGPFRFASDGTLPTGLSPDTDYWVKRETLVTMTMYLSKADAVAQTNEISISDEGTGTHSLLSMVDPEFIFNALKNGHSAHYIENVGSIDPLRVAETEEAA